MNLEYFIYAVTLDQIDHALKSGTKIKFEIMPEKYHTDVVKLGFYSYCDREDFAILIYS